MIRPKFNRLQVGNKVRIENGTFEDVQGGTICRVIAIKKNRMGQTIWGDLDDHSGLEPFRVLDGQGLTLLE